MVLANNAKKPCQPLRVRRALCFSEDLLKYLRSMYKPPEKLLHAKCHKMEKIEVRVLLCRLLGSERRAHPAYGTKKLKPYFLRLKWKRIKVANHYEKIGGILIHKQNNGRYQLVTNGLGLLLL